MRRLLFLVALGLLAGSSAQAALTREDFKVPVEGVPPERLRAAVREAYRVAPDRRFVLAIGDVARILGDGGAPRAELRKEPESGWAVMAGGARVALLAEGAGFQPLWRAVVERAKALAQGVPARPGLEGRDAQCEPFLAPGAWAALEKAQADWTADTRDVRALGIAARCLVALSLQHLDAMEIGDALPARALAALAVYHVRSGENVLGELAAMAEAMGYRATARELAAQAPPGRAAQADRYLALLRAPRALESREPELAMLRIRFTVDDGRSPIAASRELPYAVLRSVWEHGGSSADVGGKALGRETGLVWNLARTLPRVLRISEEELLATFERLLARAARGRAGPFADAEVIAAWYRGYFYSALFTMARHHLEQLSPARPADEFAARLGAAEEGFASYFRKWYAAMASARTAKEPPEGLFLDFNHAVDVGPPAIALYEELRGRMVHLFPNDFLLKARLLFRRIDDRPAHRVTLARLAYSAPLHDGPLARGLIESAVRESAVDLPPQHRDATPQADAIQALVASPAISADDLATALEWLAQREPRPLEALARGYRGLVERRPAELRHATVLAEVLEAGGRPGDARATLEQWLARNREAAAYDRAQAELGIAQLLFREGRLREALSALQAPLRWEIDRALWLSSLAHEALGEPRAADAAARALRLRHPESHLAPLAQAELDWRRGRPREAAEALAQSRHAVQTAAGMATLSQRFLEVFDESRPAAQAHAAFDALRALFHPFLLREVVLAAQGRGRHRLAFDLGSRLEAAGLGGAELAVTAYQSLKRISPPDLALEWLAARVPGEVADRVAQLAHRRGAAEAMWLNPAEPADPKAGHLWLLRAAEARLSADREREQALRERFAAPRADFHGTLTRHLLGLAAEAEVFRLVRSPQEVYTLAYFLGAKAEAEGRVADAAAWYRVVLESGVFTSAPDRDGAVPHYSRLQWWQEMLRTGALFSPTEMRWALGRLPVLRDRLLSGEAAAR